MPLAQQEMTMFKKEDENTAPEVLTDEQLELVSGGDIIDGNIPICPPWFPGRPGGHPGPTFPVAPTLNK
jgi:hypothetical protein